MDRNYKQKLFLILLVLPLTVACFYGCTKKTKPVQTSSSWCDKELRPQLKNLTEIKTKRKWFRVHNVGDDVYAIAEPYNYQEVISYLVLGKEKALLFDTGMGLDSISIVVKGLTALPVIVLNSHTHYDHVGSNHEFDEIFAMNTGYTKANAAKGYGHELVKKEVAPDAFCLRRLPNTDTANYKIRPFKISKFIIDQFIIDLGGRKIKVTSTPGHTPDAIALLDEQNGYLWTGDTFYEGPIFLFSTETDLNAYQKSIRKLALMAAKLKKVFPAHNLPIADPRLLIEANSAFMEIKNGAIKGEMDEKTVLFKFEKFSFLIEKDLLN